MRTRTQNLMEKYPELAHRSSSPKSTLLQLPNEILLEIYRHVDAILDAASLALVDGRLFAVSWQRLDELHRLQYGNWAGDQIICLGKSTKVDDLPKSVTAVWEEQAEWMERLEIEVGPDRGDPDELDDPLQQANNNHVDRDSSGSGMATRPGLRMESRPDMRTKTMALTLIRGAWKAISPKLTIPEERKAPYRRIRWYYTSPKGDDSLWDSRRRYDSKAFRELLQPETPKPHEQVLCNISKGQYVRADAIRRGITPLRRGAYTNDYKMAFSGTALANYVVLISAGDFNSL
ncbi:hypothetical protein BC629DRAFT_1738232 [Irpex lacteus]|nr:hypothetical protein BC629DRAFT_1738232 [Irpex lacteus]